MVFESVRRMGIVRAVRKLDNESGTRDDVP